MDPRIEITEENYKLLQVLDLITNYELALQLAGFSGFY
jgi:hypothetical protein